MADHRKVIATFPDGSKREYTVQRLRVLYRNEPATWQYNFFYDLLNKGRVATPIANFKLVDLDHFSHLNKKP